MKNLWIAIKEFANFTPQKQIIVALLGIIIWLYIWGKGNDDKIWAQQQEIKNLNIEKFQLQRDKEIQIVACEQRVYNVRVETDIKCQKEIQEIHKSYAESARQFKKTFDKHR